MPSVQGKGINELIQKVIKRENHKNRNSDNKISFE